MIVQNLNYTAATYRKRNDEGDSRRDLSQPLSDFKRSLPGKSAHRDPCYRRDSKDIKESHNDDLLESLSTKNNKLDEELIETFIDFRLEKHRKDPKYQ
ncbi:hypothetical protein EfmJHP38_04830 [Enterococcus faecium]|nr:hypothetical protein EfmJHP38_04830 [Enterococcus faecium]